MPGKSTPSRELLTALYTALRESPARDAVMRFTLAQMIQNVSELRHPRGHQDIQDAVELDGCRYSVDLGDRLGVEFAYGLYREMPEAMAFIGSLPLRGRLIDVGANFGFFTVRGARQMGAGGAVLALEPHPQARALLQRNIATNGIERIVTVLDAGAAEENGRREFHFAAESAFSGLADTGRARISKVKQVAVRTLDSLVAEYSWEQVDGIKIDVEGFEYAVLEGSLALLARNQHVVVTMEASPKNLNEERWHRFLAVLDKCSRLGLKPWWIDWRDGNLRPVGSMARGIAKAAGTIFLAGKSSEGWKRLEAAARAVVACRADTGVRHGAGSAAAWVQTALTARRSDLPEGKALQRKAASKRLEAKVAALEIESQARLALYHNAERAIAEQRALLGKAEAELAKQGIELVQRADSLKDLTARWTRAQEEAAARKLAAEERELRARKAEHVAEELRTLLAKCEGEFAERGESLKDLTARWTRSQEEARRHDQRVRELERESAALLEDLGAAQRRIARLDRELASAMSRAQDLDRAREVLAAERERLEAQIGALEGRLAGLSARHAALEAKFQSPSALARQWFRLLGGPRCRSPD